MKYSVFNTFSSLFTQLQLIISLGRAYTVRLGMTWIYIRLFLTPLFSRYNVSSTRTSSWSSDRGLWMTLERHVGSSFAAGRLRFLNALPRARTTRKTKNSSSLAYKVAAQWRQKHCNQSTLMLCDLIYPVTRIPPVYHI